MIDIKKILHEDPGLFAGYCMTGFFVSVGMLSLFWTPYDVTTIDVAARLAPPTSEHWFGANQFGRDVLSMVMAGTSATIFVALIAVSLAILIGVPLGLAASAFSILDDVIMRTSDIVFAFPAIILAILLAAIYGPSAMNAAIAIAIFNVPIFARVTRGASLPIWKQNFVLAAKLSAKSRGTIAYQHILPNIAPILLVQASIQFSMAVLAEAGLSYVGLGVQPPSPSWGRMLAESQSLVSIAPWLAIAPGLAIFLFVIGINLIAVGLRRRIDPRALS